MGCRSQLFKSEERPMKIALSALVVALLVMALPATAAVPKKTGNDWHLPIAVAIDTMVVMNPLAGSFDLALTEGVEGENDSAILVTSAVSPTVAIPEPMTWALMLVGLATLFFTASKRKKMLVS